jgi:hypothetical protein
MKKEAMDGLFLTIFHGERSELREKYGLVSVPRDNSSGLVLASNA